MNRQDFFAKWSSLHGDVEIRGIVKGWLTLSFIFVRPLALARISPHFLTIAGLLFGVLTWRQDSDIWALVFLALSLLSDGLDGSLAIMRNRQSQRGAALDSIVDRITEVFWALTFYRIGGHVEIVFLAWLFASTQEYARARMGGLGLRDVGVVTIAERPVRASLLAIALVAHGLQLTFVGPLAVIWLGMQAWSLLSVMRFAYLRLKKS